MSHILFFWVAFSLSFVELHALHAHRRASARTNMSHLSPSVMPPLNHTLELLETRVKQLPIYPEKLLAFFDSIASICKFKQPAVDLFDCIHENSLNSKLASVTNKLVASIETPVQPKRIIIEGFGPVGGYAALMARLNGHTVTIFEKNAFFTEHQAFAVFETTVKSLLDLGLDISHLGFCKDVSQLLYLSLLALFPSGVTYFNAEVFQWDSNDHKLVVFQWPEDKDFETKAKAKAKAKEIEKQKEIEKATEWEAEETEEAKARAIAKVKTSKEAQEKGWLEGFEKEWRKNWDQTWEQRKGKAFEKTWEKKKGQTWEKGWKKLWPKIQRDERRDWLKKSDLYHKSYTDLKTHFQIPNWLPDAPFKLPKLLKIQGDFIFAAAGTASTFHHIIPNLESQWVSMANLIDDEIGPIKKATSIGMIMKFKLPKGDIKSEDLEKWDNDLKALADPNFGQLHQFKLVPRRAYNPSIKNEIWVENVLTVEDIQTNWDSIQPVLAPETEDINVFLARRSFLHLDLRIDASDSFKNVEDKSLMQILRSWLYPEKAEAKLLKQFPNLELSNAHLTSFFVGNRILPEDKLIVALSDPTKIIFIGDAFHEALFASGKGLNTHIFELAGGEDGAWVIFKTLLDVPTATGITATQNEWKENAWAKGSKYVQEVGYQLNS